MGRQVTELLGFETWGKRLDGLKLWLRDELETLDTQPPELTSAHVRELLSGCIENVLLTQTLERLGSKSGDVIP